MPKARGTFSVWYVARQGYFGDHHEHGITASSRAELMRIAREKCPEGKAIKSISWQWNGTWTVWFRVTGKPATQCWDNDRCRLAFGE